MELVVAAAIAIADEAGLAAVTMAAVAKRCGFTTMSLYRHVASKDELVRRMLDDGLGTAAAVRHDRLARRPGAWARAMLDMLDRHPWGIDIPITGMLDTHAQLSWLDRGLEALAAPGLHEGDKAELVLLLNGYVFWAARLRRPGARTTRRGGRPARARPLGLPVAGGVLAAGVFEDETTRTRTSRSASNASWTASRPDRAC